MARIKQLSIHEAQKIAAGEVVDRPANVVKELIENAIDAKASHITIHIEDGGKKLIRIIDNGCGMSQEDSHLCFKHHATSKITTVSDLDSLTTFGFRGEALSSIAAVSKITLNTQQTNAQAGSKLELEQGSVIKEQSISRTTGTDIAVHELFYNVPARKKFLKTRETEWRHIVQLFYAFCLAYRSIHFVLYADSKQIHNCPPIQSITDRFAQLWDHHLVQHMLELEKITQEKHDYSISGAVSNHSYSRFDRSMIFLFVNNRWIKDHYLSRALLRGYNNVLQPGHFPVACIFISINQKLVDINIHPRKEEIKFLHPRIIEISLQEAIKQTLHSYLTKHLQKQDKEIPFNTKPALIQKQTAKKESSSMSLSDKLSSSPISFDFNKPVFTESSIDNRYRKKFHKHDEQKNVADTTKEKSHDYMIIGQLHKTYILVEQHDGLFIIDQHAAHERILYEQFSNRFENSTTVKLLFPQIIKLSSDDLSLIKSHLSHFKEKGIDIELFGNDQLIIHATPVHLKNVNLDDLVKLTIGWIIEYQHLNEEELEKKLNDKMHAKMACSAAVKAGDSLNIQQMQQLIYDLKQTNDRLTCPHGRPTGWLLYKNEIEKKFKRDYRSTPSYLKTEL